MVAKNTSKMPIQSEILHDNFSNLHPTQFDSVAIINPSKSSFKLVMLPYPEKLVHDNSWGLTALETLFGLGREVYDLFLSHHQFHVESMDIYWSFLVTLVMLDSHKFINRGKNQQIGNSTNIPLIIYYSNFGLCLFWSLVIVCDCWFFWCFVLVSGFHSFCFFLLVVLFSSWISLLLRPYFVIH